MSREYDYTATDAYRQRRREGRGLGRASGGRITAAAGAYEELVSAFLAVRLYERATAEDRAFYSAQEVRELYARYVALHKQVYGQGARAA